MYQPLLSVDLTRGRIESLGVAAAIRRRWIGGTGLGLYLLSQEIHPGVRATDSECPAFILTGPLTGTEIPQSSDWVTVTVNADLPTHICASHCHGYLGARLRQAGWDGIKPEILLLDEPTAGMSAQETRETIRLIEHITRERGLTLLFTEHDMEVVFAIAHRITVLHQGEVIADGTPEDVRRHPEVRRVYLGERR